MMLTQEQIDVWRSFTNISQALESTMLIKTVGEKHALSQLLDMTEILLALQWADQWNADRTFCECDACPFSTWDGCNRECQSAYAHRNEWLKAYKERTK